MSLRVLFCIFSALTSDNRDNWAEAFKVLIKDKQNKANVDEIQQSLFLVALDDDMSNVPAYDNMSRSALQSLHGLASTENRWNDKAMQVKPQICTLFTPDLLVGSELII